MFIPIKRFSDKQWRGQCRGQYSCQRLDDDVFQWQMRKMQGYKLGLAAEVTI